MIEKPKCKKCGHNAPLSRVVGHYHEIPPAAEPCGPTLATRDVYQILKSGVTGASPVAAMAAAAPHILQQAGRDFGTSGGGRASDSGAYARGVAAAREAIAAAKYDAERSHAEWFIHEVVVPEDRGS